MKAGGKLKHGRHGPRAGVITLGGDSYRRRGSSRAAVMTLGGDDFKYKRLGGSRPAARPLPGGRLGRRVRNIPQAAALTAAAALCAGLWISFSAFPPRLDKADTAPGLALLETLEQRDPGAVDAVLQARAPETVWEGGDGEELDLDLSEVWGKFQNYVILGDSRAVGFYYFDFLDPSRVLADGGDTIRRIEEHMDEIVALQPRYIYLCYGLNDISIGFWDTPQEYREEYMGIVATLKERLPEATVVISSTLPARDPAFEMSTAWYNIPEFNAELAAACQEEAIPFADNAAIAEAHGDLWDEDGIHLRPDFYPYWGKNLLEAVWNYEKETGAV